MNEKWVYIVDDPESGFSCADDACDNYCPGEIIEMEEAQVTRRFFAVKMLDLNDEWETREFATAQEADAWVKQRQAELAAAEAAAQQ